MQVGDFVRYWKGVKAGDPTGASRITQIGSLGSGEVAWLDGVSGCVALTHLEKVEPVKEPVSTSSLLLEEALEAAALVLCIHDRIKPGAIIQAGNKTMTALEYRKGMFKQALTAYLGVIQG